MKFFIEHCRSRKFAEKTGMTWWNIRDGWPVISDSVVDYYGRRKLAYDYIKRAQQDAQLAMETGLWNFDAKAGYVHFLRMMLDAQKPDGRVPCILPCTEKFGYGWGSGPAWDAALFEIPWQVYRFYGDDALAREAYGAMKRYLAFIDGKAREDGLVEYGLGDWCAPEGAAKAPTRLTDSAYVYEFNRRTAFWAERFGEPAVAAACRERRYAEGVV